MYILSINWFSYSSTHSSIFSVLSDHSFTNPFINSFITSFSSSHFKHSPNQPPTRGIASIFTRARKRAG